MSVNENEPVKCKDCNTWWRGLEHRCKPLTLPKFNEGPNEPPYDSGPNLKPRKKDPAEYEPGCKLCGARGAHYCTGPKKDYIYTCGWCGKKVDYRYSHNCERRGKE